LDEQLAHILQRGIKVAAARQLVEGYSIWCSSSSRRHYRRYRSIATKRDALTTNESEPMKEDVA